MSETTKRCKDWCGKIGYYHEEERCFTAGWSSMTDPCWCSPECRDNRRRMNEGNNCPQAGQHVCTALCFVEVISSGPPDRSLGEILRDPPKLDLRAPAPAVEGEPRVEPTYPCEQCGKPRTKAEGGTTFTVCDARWDKHHGKRSSAGEPPTLTFAEAMALPVDEVEFTFKQGNEVGPLADWLQLKDHPGIRIDWLRECGFRRRKPAPALTRVQQMAQATKDGTATVDVISEAIRAVCKWVRESTHDDADDWAQGIKREFLGPGEGSRS